MSNKKSSMLAAFILGSGLVTCYGAAKGIGLIGADPVRHPGTYSAIICLLSLFGICMTLIRMRRAGGKAGPTGTGFRPAMGKPGHHALIAVLLIGSIGACVAASVCLALAVIVSFLFSWETGPGEIALLAASLGLVASLPFGFRMGGRHLAGS